MTRLGHVGGNATRTAVIAITLVASFTVAFGPVGPSSFVAAAGGAPSPSTAPGAAPTAPGPLPGDATVTAAATTTDTTTTTTDSVTTTTTTTDTTTTTTTTTSSTATTPLPGNVLDDKGGTITLGHVDLTLQPGALQFETRFSLAPANGPDYAGIPPVEDFRLRGESLGTRSDITMFGVPGTLTVHTESLDLSGLSLGSLRIARLADDGTWDVLPTHQGTDLLSATIDGPGTFGVVGKSQAPTVDLAIMTDAPSAGRHRVDPGATVHVTVTATATGPMSTATLYVGLPADWTLVDADGGAVDPQTGQLAWRADAIADASTFARHLVLTAPSVAADSKQYEYTGTFTARVVQKRSPVYRADPVSVLVAPRLVIQHKVVGKIDRDTRVLEYESEDTDLPVAKLFTVIRLRFRVENPDSVPVDLTPLIQYLDKPSSGQASSVFVPVPMPGILALPGAASTSWVTLPSATAEHGQAKFYVAPEARDWKPEVDPIDDSETKTHDDEGPQAGTGLHAAAGTGQGSYTRGVHSMGDNPAPTISIAGDGWTEVEFSVRATGWADWSTTYDLRLTDGGVAIEPSVVASLAIQTNPDAGKVGSADKGDGSGAYGPWPAHGPYALEAATAYPLRTAAGSTAATTLRAAGVIAAAVTSPHGDLAIATDSCAACHRSHSAQAQYLRTVPLPQSQACFTCHNGLGASTDIQSQYATATANVPSTASYYQHPATTAGSGHLNALNTEFAGVANRHAECSDCHNPHNPTATSLLAASTGSGWRVSGALRNASGVQVTNGAAGSAPTYGWLSTRPGDETADDFPTPVGQVTYEYELCLKCHSGYTTLLATSGVPISSHPSWWALDKGVEFNPANEGVHPIEGPGSNATAAMGNSLTPLAGADTTYRKWTLTVASTVRCEMCHGNPAQTPTGPNASSGIRLDTHVSPNRGILRATYRDRVTRTGSDPYVAADFSLCYQCHAIEPFTAGTGARTDTNFRYHGFHLANITGKGSSTSTDIDAPGAGASNAICSECHFRTHSNVFRFGTYTLPAGGYLADRLVNFSPNVTAYGGILRWQRLSTGTGGNCTLTCHGFSHNNENY